MYRAARRYLSFAVVAVCLATAAGGQDLRALENSTPQQRADIQTTFMAKRLGLSPEERSKVADINLKYAQQAQPILTGSEGPLRKMEALKGMQGQKDSDLKAVLTPAQYKKYLASKEALRAHL